MGGRPSAAGRLRSARRAGTPPESRREKVLRLPGSTPAASASAESPARGRVENSPSSNLTRNGQSWCGSIRSALPSEPHTRLRFGEYAAPDSAPQIPKRGWEYLKRIPALQRSALLWL